MNKTTLKSLTNATIPAGMKFNFENTMHELKQLESVTSNAHHGYTMTYLKWNDDTATVEYVTAEIADDRGIFIPTQAELDEWAYINRARAIARAEERLKNEKQENGKAKAKAGTQPRKAQPTTKRSRATRAKNTELKILNALNA